MSGMMFDLVEGLVRVHLLNTDWTEPANERLCTLRIGPAVMPLKVREGRLTEVAALGSLPVLLEDKMLSIKLVLRTGDQYTLSLHGCGTTLL